MFQGVNTWLRLKLIFFFGFKITFITSISQQSFKSKYSYIPVWYKIHSLEKGSILFNDIKWYLQKKKISSDVNVPKMFPKIYFKVRTSNPQWNKKKKIHLWTIKITSEEDLKINTKTASRRLRSFIFFWADGDLQNFIQTNRQISVKMSRRCQNCCASIPNIIHTKK